MLSSTLLILFLWTHHVTGLYEVAITFHSYHNPSRRCDGCRQAEIPGPGCCDESFIRASTEACLQNDTCDTTVDYCVRSLGSTDDGCPDNQLVTSDFAYVEVDSYSSFAPDFFGLHNPLLVTGNSSWTGIQLFLQSKDAIIVNHGFSDSVLIDSFFIDINSPVGVSSPARTYLGNASIAQVSVSFEVRCANDYYGRDCQTLCPDFRNCLSCGLPGFNGTFCQSDINDCEGIVCNISNSHCVDRTNGYTCECDFGFTGADCEEVIDCLGVTCSGNGQCQGLLGSFTCVCEPGYTGALCEVNARDCESISCGENGVCVDGVDSFECVCSGTFTGQYCEKIQESGSGDGTGGNYSIAAYYANVGGIVGGLVGGLLSLIIICLALALLTTGFLSLRKTGKQLKGLEDKESQEDNTRKMTQIENHVKLKAQAEFEGNNNHVTTQVA